MYYNATQAFEQGIRNEISYDQYYEVQLRSWISDGVPFKLWLKENCVGRWHNVSSWWYVFEQEYDKDNFCFEFDLKQCIVPIHEKMNYQVLLSLRNPSTFDIAYICFDWCDTNCVAKWGTTPVLLSPPKGILRSISEIRFEFQSEEDAIWFKLVYG